MTDTLLTRVPENSPASTDSEMVGKPENVPAKFWDSDKKEMRLEALLNSYLSLEKRLSKMVPMPESADDKKRLQKLLGCPECADEYQVTLKSDMVEIDPDLNKRLHEKGFTNEQVQEIYDLATEKLVPMLLEMASEFQADRELERLVKEFGGAEKWNLVSSQLQDFGKKNLPPSAYEGLCCSYDGVMALYNMMKTGSKSPIAKENGGSFDLMDEQGLRAMMKDPKYWRDRDPAFIARVSDGFQKIYKS